MFYITLSLTILYFSRQLTCELAKGSTIITGDKSRWQQEFEPRPTTWKAPLIKLLKFINNPVHFTFLTVFFYHVNFRFHVITLIFVGIVPNIIKVFGILVFENRILRQIFGLKMRMGEWRKLLYDELHSLYRSPNICMVIKSSRLRKPEWK